jgi:ACS family hexuronate transporter-like MFS transporter
MSCNSEGVAETIAPVRGRVGQYRWVICALIFAATVINYIDRQMIGVLKPTLQQEFGWSEVTYGDIIFWFQAAYALGFVAFGRLMDRLGTRLGYALAMTLWTLASVAHGAARSAVSFMAARFVLGIGESGNFPASLKAVADWFPLGTGSYRQLHPIFIVAASAYLIALLVVHILSPRLAPAGIANHA